MNIAIAAVVASLLRTLAQEAPAPLEQLDRDVAAVVQKIRPSVVAVVVDSEADGAIRMSGVVYTAQGHIVSAYRCVSASTRVLLAGGRELPARVVGQDRRSGIAVLQVKAENLAPAKLAAADERRAGAPAIIVGNSLGLRGSAAWGVVAGSGRAIVVEGRRFDDMLQLTVPAHPGDCGGYIANARGELIGLVHSSYRGDDLEALLDVLRRDPEAAAGTRLTFGTPVSEVAFVADRIIKHGRMVRGWAGLVVGPLDETMRAQLSLPGGVGCEVRAVDPQGPAAVLLQRRDVLLRVGDRDVKDVAELKRWIVAHEEPREVAVEFVRDGKRQQGMLHIKIESP